MEVKQMYFVQDGHRVTALYELANSEWLLDVSHREKRNNNFTFQPLKKADAEQRINEAKSGKFGTVLKEAANLAEEKK